MKRIIRLTESDLTRIVRRVISEEDKKDVYSDLYGKTSTFKSIEGDDVIIKGIIEGMNDNTTRGKGIDIKLKEPKTMGQTNGLFFNEENNDYYGNLNYDCATKTFYIKLEGKQKVYTVKKFTCKGLSDVLSQRYPCATDFSMNDDNVPNNLA
jgi:hypothetical protein